MNFEIEVNHKPVEAIQGETILETLKRNGIKVPTLCHLKGMLPTGACRICIVENETTGKLIPSCSQPIEPGMKIITNSPRVVESRKTIIELLLSNHPDDCLYCVRNKNCELQDLSETYHVRERRIRGKKNEHHLDLSSTAITRDPAKCILCERCVRVCEEIIGVSAIDILYRGADSVVGTAFNKGLNTSSCINCGQCIKVCPTGALSEKSHFPEIVENLRTKKKKIVAQYAPSITVSLAEEFGMPVGTDMNGLLNAALRKIGFDFVFDTSFSADLTIMEETAELIHRIQNNGVLPLFTSCCPGWVKYAETFTPDLLPHVSSCKSPQQMMGAVVKSYFAEKVIKTKPEDIYSVSIMPCTVKKFEQQRIEMTRHGINDVDAVLTTREIIKLIKFFEIDIKSLEPESTDSPMGIRSSAGKIFANTGGVMEAALRTTYFKLTGKELPNYKIPQVRGLDGVKIAKIDINGLEVGVAVVNGLKNAESLLEEIRNGRKDIHFVEIMACPGGCINGGGQPINMDEKVLRKRIKAIYEIDQNDTMKVSHKNPEIIEIYQNYFDKPLGHKSHELLHTHYEKREVLK